MAVIARASFFSIGFLLWKNTPPTSHRAHVRFPTACRLKFHQLDQDVHQSLPTAHTVLPRFVGILSNKLLLNPCLSTAIAISISRTFRPSLMPLSVGRALSASAASLPSRLA